MRSHRIQHCTDASEVHPWIINPCCLGLPINQWPTTSAPQNLNLITRNQGNDGINSWFLAAIDSMCVLNPNSFCKLRMWHAVKTILLSPVSQPCLILRMRRVPRISPGQAPWNPERTDLLIVLFPKMRPWLLQSANQFMAQLVSQNPRTVTSYHIQPAPHAAEGCRESRHTIFSLLPMKETLGTL
jgi:hypothetical protein